MAKLICKIFGHKIVFAPFLPGPENRQNWYDTVCTRCGTVHTVFGGVN